MTTAEGDTTSKRKVLGLVLVFVGIGLYFLIPGIFIILEDYLTKEAVTWLVRGLMPLVWVLPIIGLGYHAKTHERTVLWAATGWFPVLGPVLGLLAMRIDAGLARWETPKIIRAGCSAILTLVLPLIIVAIAIPGFRAFHKSDNIQQESTANTSTNITRER